MAIVVRYFSTTSAGAADGTTWADRAALFSSGNWSSIITGNNFLNDTLRCRIGAGTYTCSQALAAGLFANAPFSFHPLVLEACDSSGNLLTPPDPTWTSAQPVTWDANLPVIATTTNIVTITQVFTFARLLKFTASGANGSVLTNTYLEWCSILNSTSNTAAVGLTSSSTLTSWRNTYVKMTGSSYSVGITNNQNSYSDNIRVEGNSSASSGNRNGVVWNGAGSTINRLCSFHHVGVGFDASTAATLSATPISNSVIVNNGSDGLKYEGSGTGTAARPIFGVVSANNSGYGINAQSTRPWVTRCKLRDNSSGNLNSFGDMVTDWESNDFTDTDDATDFVDATNLDFRIKESSVLWGQSIGVADQTRTYLSASVC